MSHNSYDLFHVSDNLEFLKEMFQSWVVSAAEEGDEEGSEHNQYVVDMLEIALDCVSEAQFRSLTETP